MAGQSGSAQIVTSPPPPSGAEAKRITLGKPSATVQVAQNADGQSALLALLKVEADAREAASERDLLLLAANETRKLTRARQVFVCRPSISGAQHVKAISSLPLVDRSAPLVQMIEGLVAEAAASGSLDAAAKLDVSATPDSSAGSSYPFKSIIWLPLRQANKTSLGGIILAREESWGDADLIVPKRLAGAYAHALSALNRPRRVSFLKQAKVSKALAVSSAVAVSCLLFLQVPLSALGPVEITPRDPFVIAAPIDGVIDEVKVDPNRPVNSGDVVVKLTDTTLRNRVEVAEREVQVAEAKLKQANQLAFSDSRGMHEIAIARSELSLKLAERDFARDLLAKTEIRAGRSGIAIYSDKRELVGKPVAVGERILEVADSAAIEARIELPVADAMTLSPGARVKVFLDSDPLQPWAATIKRADYKARAGDNDVMSFRVVATLTTDDSRPLPRLGVRGTAQVSGEDVPLGFYIFRRPLTSVRQWLGW